MKRPSKLIILIFFIILGLSLVLVSIENSISTTGIELVKLQEKLSSYKKDNSLLTEKYLEKSSLLNVASKAAELGFAESKNQVYLSDSIPLALKP